jgi:anti-sigma-K factor RskA
MTCEQHLEALGEYVDGTLPPEERRRLDEHLATCEGCRGVAADVARIRKSATELPAVAPPERVWTRIANELDLQAAAARATATPGEEPRRRPRAAFLRFLVAPIPLLGTAVVLLAVVAGYLAISRTTVAPAPVKSAKVATAAPGDSAAHAADADLVQSVEAELQQAEQHYEKAIAGLEQITKAGQGNLDPQVAETLQRNLLVIDQAIRDSKQALDSQPTSELAQESLLEAFRRKVSLLQDTVALINEMRKGNQDGAARIIGNMNK